MKRPLAALLIVALVEPALLACPVCFQADDGPTSRGIQAAVIVLFSVTTCVLTVCGAFVARFASREREVLRGESQFRKQPEGSTLRSELRS